MEYTKRVIVIALAALWLMPLGCGSDDTGSETTRTPDGIQVQLAGAGEKADGLAELGYVERGSEHRIRFVLRNDTGSDLSVKGIRSQCECMKVVEEPEAIAAGGAAALVVDFEAPVDAQSYDKWVLVLLGERGKRQAALRVRADVGRPLLVEPPELGEVSAGEPIKGQIQLHNRGSAPIRLAYAMSSSSGLTVDVPRAEISPGGTVAVPFVLRPDGQAGSSQQASVRIQTDSQEQPSVTAQVHYIVK